MERLITRMSSNPRRYWKFAHTVLTATILVDGLTEIRVLSAPSSTTASIAFPPMEMP